MPINRYLSGINRDTYSLKTFYVLDFVPDAEGINHSVLVEDKTDMSQYGSFEDWSLSAMFKAGIDPNSFSSPSVSINRLDASSAVSSIDLSNLDVKSTE